ncbi:MAG: radical SAM protein [Deltaproteobacteria bacterium]|jgi:Fe-coproporphyrin III synthase|nr:radical SAM protein [Deltaproteobacteria bacterium]
MATKKHRLWRGKVLPRLALTVAPLPKNTFCSIDVTSKCNLRCTHCYFFSYTRDNRPELTVDEWLEKIKKMQSAAKPFFSCTWVGGEPLLKQEVIAKGKEYFKSNRVVTNGTIPLPDWKDVEFHISVDGTRESHDQIRGGGCYDRIKKNILSAKELNLQIVLACCLNRHNVDSIDGLLEEWSNHPNIKHILFNFFTPIKGANEKVWLSFDERDEILSKLESLKERYGDFIGAPSKTFDLMKGKNHHRAVGKNCVFIKYGTAFDAWGKVKRPCVIGPFADCDKCGCIVPFSVKAWKRPSNLLKEIWREFTK